jgi:predicted phage-related endonuclease
MSNPNMEAKVKELMELKRMKEEIEAEIAAAEDEIKAVMGSEETLLAGAFKVDWKTVITSRIDTAALKKVMPEIAERFMKQTTTRRFCVR